MNNFLGYDLDNLPRECIKEVGAVSRIIGAEGIVLLKNENVLPLEKNKRVSVFGRTQIDYIKSGTGSGGKVNTTYNVNIIDGLSGRIAVNEELLSVYREWLKDHPFDIGHGWATEPWAQEEMPVDLELCKRAAEISDCAVVVIGRSAGEDRDNFNAKKSYLLTDTEEKLIESVGKCFEKYVVVLNTGNIIDMKWVEKYNVPSVMYSWQGGSEGGNALADVLLGDTSPSGRLVDTVAYNIEDYPSTKNHGGAAENIYEEDVYVGYRYFETFAKDKVMYPFGFGLSYTEFAYDYSASCENGTVTLSVAVKNIGKYAGKTVVQVYYAAPQGRLGKPARALVRYKKTKLLDVGECENISISFPVKDMASYDDKERFAHILEGGEYVIYAGENVRDAKEVLKIELEETVVEQLRQAMAPVKAFDRMIPIDKNGEFVIGHEAVTTRKYDTADRVMEHIGKQEPPTGSRGITLRDVKDGKSSMQEFINQLSVTELACLLKGEGMNSPKVTAGTGGAFGGVTNALLAYGIPILCVTDGPSGIRMDSGEKASLIPNGTCLASSWNPELTEKLYAYLGIELRAHEIDILLAPGMNIHRHPLNGRNFEYFSEDPYLAGTIGAACTRGLDSAGVAGTIKHFACNSQEFKRYTEDSVLSERALREIYLKPFEISVKEGNASAIMTSYNLVNGRHTAADYNLCTSILRDDWGYRGIVMTDWWTYVDGPDKANLAPMVEAQNDLYMVTPSSGGHNDNIVSSVEEGRLDIGQLRRCADNILRYALNSPAMNRRAYRYENLDLDKYTEAARFDNITSGSMYDMEDADAIKLIYKTVGSEMAQYVIDIYDGDSYLTCALVQASGAEEKSIALALPKCKSKTVFKFVEAFDHIDVIALKK